MKRATPQIRSYLQEKIDDVSVTGIVDYASGWRLAFDQLNEAITAGNASEVRL